MWITRPVRVAVIILGLLLIIQGSYLSVTAKKTAKEWAEFNRKIREIEEEERKEMSKTLGNDVPVEKPGMVFANFGKQFTKQELDKVAVRYSIQLQSAGVKVSIFETGPSQWVVATFRTKDTYDVVKYLREQPEVMKATLEPNDYWNLPRYQKEFDAEVAEKLRKGEKPPENLPNPEPPVQIDEATRKRLTEELIAQFQRDQAAKQQPEVRAEL